MSYPVLARWAITTLFGALILLGGQAQAQLAIMPTNEHPNPFRTIDDFFDLPDGRTWGSTSAVDIDPDGTSIWVAERCGTNSCATSEVDPIIKYDSDGNVVTHFGGGVMIWPHGIDVDDQGTCG